MICNAYQHSSENIVVRYTEQGEPQPCPVRALPVYSTPPPSPPSKKKISLSDFFLRRGRLYELGFALLTQLTTNSGYKVYRGFLNFGILHEFQFIFGILEGLFRVFWHSTKLQVNFDPGQGGPRRPCDSTSGNLNKKSVREKSRGGYLPIG